MRLTLTDPRAKYYETCNTCLEIHDKSWENYSSYSVTGIVILSRNKLTTAVIPSCDRITTVVILSR